MNDNGYKLNTIIIINENCNETLDLKICRQWMNK